MTDTTREAVERRKVVLPEVPFDNDKEIIFGEGVTYAIQIVAEALGIHPDEFSWDAATEEFEGDVRCIVENMLSVITEDHSDIRALLAAKEAAEADKTLLKAVLDGAEYRIDMEWLREHGTEGAHAVGAEAARVTKSIIEARKAAEAEVAALREGKAPAPVSVGEAVNHALKIVCAEVGYSVEDMSPETQAALRALADKGEEG